MKCHYKATGVLKLNILAIPSIDQDVKEVSKEFFFKDRVV